MQYLYSSIPRIILTINGLFFWSALINPGSQKTIFSCMTWSKKKFLEKKKFMFLQSMKRGRIKGYLVFTQKVSGRFGFQFFEKQTFHKLEIIFFWRNLFQTTRLYIWRNIEWLTSNSVLGEEWKFLIGLDEFLFTKDPSIDKRKNSCWRS